MGAFNEIIFVQRTKVVDKLLNLPIMKHMRCSATSPRAEGTVKDSQLSHYHPSGEITHVHDPEQFASANKSTVDSLLAWLTPSWLPPSVSLPST